MSAIFQNVRALAPAALLLALASLALIVADLGLVAFGARVDPSNAIGRSGAIDVGGALAALSFAGIGLVLTRARAGRGMGTLLQLIGLAIAISLFSTAYASYALVTDPTLPGAVTMMWLANWVWQPMASLTLFFLPVLFPNGQLPSARWRWLAMSSITLAIAGSVGPAFLDGPMQPPFQSRLNPIGIPQAHAVMDALTKLAYAGTTIVPVAGIAALAMRYRRAQALERAQLRWFIASAILLVIAFAVTSIAYGQRGLEPVVAVGTILFVLALIGVPTAVGLAVLRYRLYDVDVLVNRAVLYGGVTVILIAAFAVANITAQRVVSALTGERSELVAAALGMGATLAYGPLSRRLRPMVDRILPARALLTLLFTDIVGSTERILELGDERWRELLDRYRSAVRQTLARWGGREINTAGDAFFAAFDRPMPGVRAATEIRAAVRHLGLECRTGLHLGEVELRGEQVSGLAVHATARVMTEAKPGEILVSRELRVAVGDEEMSLADRGRHSLKGLPGEWQLYAVEPSRA